MATLTSTIFMAKAKIAGVEHTPANHTPALKRSSSNTQNMKNQQSLLGFFQKTPNTASKFSSSRQINSFHITPTPSSDALDEDENVPERENSKESSRPKGGLPSPASSANGALMGQTIAGTDEVTVFGTPSRKVGYDGILLVNRQ